MSHLTRCRDCARPVGLGAAPTHCYVRWADSRRDPACQLQALRACARAAGREREAAERLHRRQVELADRIVHSTTADTLECAACQRGYDADDDRHTAECVAIRIWDREARRV